tara:strand:- start:42050 stop:42727 length:678 start_codon:yes stop_codon:yes gene_type:complete
MMSSNIKIDTDILKKKVAKAAIDYIIEDAIIGVGTGSTVGFFIEELAKVKHLIKGTVSSSKDTTEKLKAHGIPVFDLNTVDEVAVYIDSADEALKYGQLIKGGGGALAQEKVVASCAKKFICIIDETKLVNKLGKFPIPVEVLPVARSLVGRELVKLGGSPVYREGFVTDHGNIIIDVEDLNITSPLEMEKEIDHITGVVSNGIFAKNLADVLLIANETGVEIYG